MINFNKSTFGASNSFDVLTKLQNQELQTDESKSAFDLWKPFELRPEILSIAVVFIILLSFTLYYAKVMKKINPKEPPKGLAFFVFNIVNSIKCLVFEILGPKFMKLTPYVITLFLYIAACNLISLFGFENPTASTTVTFSMGIMTVIISITTAIRYQKRYFLWRFLFMFSYKSKKSKKSYKIPVFVNPFGFLDFITPVLSISLRLWGNIFAGGLILTLIYAIPMVFFNHNPLIQDPQAEIILFSIIAAPFHGFLDLVIGLIQAFVFVVLSLSYWGNEFSNEFVDEKIKETNRILQEKGIDEWEKNQSNVQLTNIRKLEK